MRSSDFKAKLLEIICPPIIDAYQNTFVPKYKEVSKPAFQSILAEDESNPMLNYDWAFLYLDETKLYKQSRLDFNSAFIPQADETHLGKDIDDRHAKVFLYIVTRFMRNFSFEDFCEIYNQSDDIELDTDFFIQVSIAQFYNSLSVVQSGKRINDLLFHFIHKGQQLSLIKAVKVDPSVLNLDEVIDTINQLNPISKNTLEGQLQSAKSIPHLSPDKRKQHLLLAVFLNLVSAIGFISAPKPIPNKLLQDIATNLNIIPDYYDEDEFRKTARYYRNR